MLLQSIVAVFVLEIYGEEQGAAGERDGVWKLADYMIELDALRHLS